jgi:hypothetical protein
MLGLLFCNAHLFSRQARTGDGDVIVRFAEEVRPVLGEEDFAIYAAKKLGTEVYVGRFAREFTSAPHLVVETLKNTKGRGLPRWLVTSDIGLLHLGAYEESPSGGIKIKVQGTKRRFQTHPEDLGRVAVRSVAPVAFEEWGTMYLIELDRPIHPRDKPLVTGYISDPVR